ncbi:flagellin N-terminal helical domain-containing protein [Priestia megaterium]
MRINHSITALNTYRQYNTVNNTQAKSVEELSSGQRINNAVDEAADLAIPEKMRGQVRGLDRASRNTQDDVSLIQTAEGALNETHDILQCMRELVVQAGNVTNKTEDSNVIQGEIGGENGSKKISDRAQLNGRNLLDGSLDVTLQIGSNAGQ